MHIEKIVIGLMASLLLPFSTTAQEKGVLRLMLQANVNNGTGHKAADESDLIMKPMVYSGEEYTSNGEDSYNMPPGYMLGAGLSYSVGNNTWLELSYGRSLSYYAFELYESYHFYFASFDSWVVGWLWWQEYDVYKFRCQFGLNQISENLYGAVGFGAIGETSRTLLTNRAGMGRILENQYQSNSNYTGGRWTGNTWQSNMRTFITPEIGYCFYNRLGHPITLSFSYSQTFQSEEVLGYEHYVDGNKVAYGEYILGGGNFSFDIRYGLNLTKFSRKKHPKEANEKLPVKDIVPGLNPVVYAPINLTIVLDASGSMGGKKIQLVKRGMNCLLDSMRGIDRFSLIAFNEKPDVLARNVVVHEQGKVRLKKSIESLKTGGNTHGGESLEKAYKIAQRSYIADGMNYVIIITDGNFNDPKFSQDQLTKLIGENLSENDLHLSIISVGSRTEINERLENLATIGGGNHIAVADVLEMETLLLKEVKAITFWHW